MALGLNTGSSGGDFLPICIYDARAGRLFKVERTQGIAGWESNRVDISSPPPAFAIDFGSIEVGWIMFSATGPDFQLVPLGNRLPDKPSKEHKPGFRVKLLGRVMDGIREFSHSAQCVRASMDDLHTKFEAAPEAAQGKIPVVKLAGTTPIVTKGPQGNTTNYAPVFEIIAWTDRSPEMGDRTVPAPGSSKPVTTPAATAHVPPPPAHVTAPVPAAAVPAGMPDSGIKIIKMLPASAGSSFLRGVYMMSAELTAEPETLMAARQYHTLGWSVVPVSPREKLPAVKWVNFQEFPADLQQINHWFSTGGYGVGLIQGAVSGTIVLDFDGETGHETRARLEAEFGELPHTVEALTPGGGCHVFLRHPGRHVHTRKAVAPGMDVRGDGGFVVASPSVHANTRRYEWDCDHHPDDVTVADCPAWVTQLICNEGPAGASSTGTVVHTLHAGPLGLPQAVVADGRETYMRDTVMAVLAGQCRALHRAPSEQELFDEVWPQYSRKVDFSRPGRGQTEVRAKCRYTLARLSKGLLPKIVVPPEADSAPKAGGRPAILHLEDVERLPPPEFLIAGLIPAGGLTVVYGPPKSGKTFLVLSAGLHIAASRDWFGRAVNGGAVVYIAGEGIGGLGNRLKAMRQHYDIPSNIPFYVIPRAVNFTDPTAPDWLVKLIRDTIGDESVAMVVVDTLARAMPGADENSAKEVGLVIAGCDRVRDVLGCAVVPIHHQGKDDAKGLRGSSAIHGAVDAVFRVKGADKQVLMRNEDQKDAERATDMVFDMVEVTVGIGRTSLVPVLTNGTLEEAERRPHGMAGYALYILTNLLAGDEAAMLPPTIGIPSGVRGVTVESFRREFYARNSERTPEARKKAFRRAFDDLVEHQYIATRDPWVWRVN